MDDSVDQDFLDQQIAERAISNPDFPELVEAELEKRVGQRAANTD